MKNHRRHFAENMVYYSHLQRSYYILSKIGEIINMRMRKKRYGNERLACLSPLVWQSDAEIWEELPACYAVIDENEMTYLDGGATIADSDAYKAFLNVGQVFNQLARIFSGASSIINNINVIYKSVVELNNLLGGFIKK